MSDFIIFALAAVCGYLAGSINPAVIASKLFYKRDIRDLGSGNPGFTNFKRNFGNTAYLVMAVDFCKAALVVSVFAPLLSYCLFSGLCLSQPSAEHSSGSLPCLFSVRKSGLF